MTTRRILHILRPGVPAPGLEAGDRIFRIGGTPGALDLESDPLPAEKAAELVRLVFEFDVVVTW